MRAPEDDCVKRLRIIDSHAHIWSQRDIPLMVEEVRRLGIAAVCVSCLADWDWSTSPDPGAGNNLVFNMASDNPEILGYIYVDPTQPQEAMNQIDRYLHHPSLVGIKLWISCPANDTRVNPVAERAVEEGLILLVHAWRRGTPLSKGYQTLPTEVAELAASFPELTVIMAHIGGDWETGALEVADARNVSVDTCGTINESGMIEKAVRTLGAERVVFGSDAPGSGFLPNLGKILSANITEAEKSQILWANMARLLKEKRGLDLELDGKGEGLGLGYADTGFLHLAMVEVPVHVGEGGGRGSPLGASGIPSPPRRHEGGKERVPSLRGARIIDSNCYLGAWPTRTLDVTSARGLEALLKGNGVGLGLVSPLSAIFQKDHLAANATMTLELKGFRESFLPVPVANPASPLGNHPSRIARFVPSYHRYSPADRHFLALLEGLRSQGGVAFISMRMRDERLTSPLLSPRTTSIRALARTLKGLPGLKAIVNNAKPDEIRTLLSETAETVVAGCEWSFPVGFVEEMVDEYGDGRLVFGSNAPLHYYASSLLQITGADIPRSSMRRILAKNIMEILPGEETPF